MFEDFNLEIGVGLGDYVGKVWWIGFMGYVCKFCNIDYCFVVLCIVFK